MGSSGSKAARAGAGAATRKFPARPNAQPPPTSRPQASRGGDLKAAGQQRQPGPTVRPSPQASYSKDEVVDLDGRDPDFANRLNQLGPVKPQPTYSPSSVANPPASSSKKENPAAAAAPATGSGVFPKPAANPAIAVIAARQRIADAAEREKTEIGRPGFQGRQYLDITTVKNILTMRDEQGMKDDEIEKILNLKKGVVASLGRIGVIEAA